MEKKPVRKVVNPWFALGTVLPYGEADFGAGTSDVSDVGPVRFAEKTS
jgi:hypothetical protein